MNKRLLILTTTCLLAAGAPLTVANADNGAELHAANCTSCHDDAVYKRKDRRVTSMAGLKKQEDVDDVTAYLNSTYYNFK
jgi:cytochrome c2